MLGLRLAWIPRAVMPLAVLIGLGYFYLHPASDRLLKGDSTVMISDGGDPTAGPFFYDLMIRAAKENPARLFYGTVYTDQMSAPEGFGLWIPAIERVIGLVLSPWVSMEGMTTAAVWIFMVLNGFMFYLLARSYEWNRPLALGLAICFAFNPYTRARASAHAALAGIYFLPTIFLALRILRKTHAARLQGMISRPGSAMRYILVSLMLLFSVMIAHYYIFVISVLAPFFLWFYLRRDSAAPRLPVIPALGRLVGLSIPALIWISWSLLRPLPPMAGPPPTVQKNAECSYCTVTYAARPIDYLAGDVALGSKDWNSLRSKVIEYVRSHLDGSNPVERSNGVRWSVLIIFFWCVVAMVLKKSRMQYPLETRRMLQFLLIFTFATYWFSLSPRSLAPLGIGIGPSRWINVIFPPFRVPSRFGPVCHFGMLWLVGMWLHYKMRSGMIGGRQRFAWALMAFVPAIAVLDFPPVEPMKLDDVRPARTELKPADGGRCGIGMFFPLYDAGTLDTIVYYGAIQQMRYTDCQLFDRLDVTGVLPENPNFRLGTSAYLDAVSAGQWDEYRDRLVNWALCTGLNWLVFWGPVSEEHRASICRELGWVRTSESSCRAPTGAEPITPARQRERAQACLSRVP